MPKFHSTRVIEAEQWFPGKKIEGVDDTSDVWGHAFVCTAHDQIVFLEPGDWVVPEPNGNGHYPIKPDILEETYERVEE